MIWAEKTEEEEFQHRVLGTGRGSRRAGKQRGGGSMGRWHANRKTGSSGTVEMGKAELDLGGFI